jgi:hypothetical protein
MLSRRALLLSAAAADYARADARASQAGPRRGRTQTMTRRRYCGCSAAHRGERQAGVGVRNPAARGTFGIRTRWAARFASAWKTGSTNPA